MTAQIRGGMVWKIASRGRVTALATSRTISAQEHQVQVSPRDTCGFLSHGHNSRAILNTLSAPVMSGTSKHRRQIQHMKKFKDDLPQLMKVLDLEGQPLPLIWTADFILGPKSAEGQDTFFVGEFNCSCVGIKKQLNRASDVAAAAIAVCSV